MAKRSAVEQIVIEERTVSDAIAKLIAAREKASAWHLKWAKFEECEFLIFLFEKLAELRWIWNETYKAFSDKHQSDYLKTFKDIYYEERVVEDAKKALHGCESSITKIKKQIDSALKKGDSVKLHSLDQELNSQLGMKEHLKKKIEGHDEKMNRIKVEQIQKGLLSQAQAGLQLADQMRHLFIAQLRIADILGSSSYNNNSTWHMITQVLIGLSGTLGLYPPPSGAVDPLPSPSESPHQGRKSAESPLPLSSPAFSSASSSGCQTPTSRRSFPFPFRPLPNEPSPSGDQENRRPQTPPQSTASPNHTPKHHHSNGGVYRTRAFTRSASDMTPVRAKTTPSPNIPTTFPYRTSITILEEQQQQSHHHDPTDPAAIILDRTRSKSLCQSAAVRSNSASSSPHHSTSSSTTQESDLDYHHHTHQRHHSNPLILGGGEGEGDNLSANESGYADPIDALRQYYGTQVLPQVERSTSGTAGEPPYQTLAEIQRMRQEMLITEEDNEDPTYSRPYDCLRGLPGPVRVLGEASSGLPGPRSYPRQYVPGNTPTHQKPTTLVSHLHRSLEDVSTSSSTSTSPSSSSPSPEFEGEDELHPLRRSNRSGSLDHLLEDSSFPEVPKIFVKVKEDMVPMRPRGNSDGNIFVKSRNRSCRPDVLSPLALTSSTASEQDHTPSTSPHNSPVHNPAEVTRLQNGFAKLVHPELSLSDSQ